MTVLVTGGTGYLGRAIVAALVSRGHEPVVFARHASRAGLPGRAVDGDVRDPAALARAARGCEAICHVAGLVAIGGDPRHFDAVNVDALHHVLALAAAGAVRRVVYTSSFLALPPAGRSTLLAANDYQRSKVAARRVAMAAIAQGLPVVCVYPGVVFGPGPMREGNLVGHLLADYLRGRLPVTVGGDRVWPFAWIEDVAAGHVAALEREAPTRHYGLGGHNRPQRDLFAWVAQRTSRRPPRALPLPLARVLAGIEEWRARHTGGVPRLTRGAVEIFSHDWPLDSGAAIRDLDYRVTPWDDALERTLDAVRAAIDRQPAG